MQAGTTLIKTNYRVTKRAVIDHKLAEGALVCEKK